MMVNFVRFHQLTVIPFPFKYLREFIQLEEKKRSAKKRCDRFTEMMR